MTALTKIPEPTTEQFGLRFLPKALPKALAQANPCGLRAECEQVLALLTPVDPKVFAFEFERMLVHYWHGGLSQGEAKILCADWLRLLGHLPADLMREGVDRYLLSRNRHKPTPGVFLELVEKDLSLRQTLARRAEETLMLLDMEAAA